MALSPCFPNSMIFPPKIRGSRVMYKHHHHHHHHNHTSTGLLYTNPQSLSTKLYVLGMRSVVKHDRAFMRPKDKVERCVIPTKTSGMCRSWMSTSQIATSGFTLGTAAVLPFYTLMIAAPKAQLTKKTMQSSLPYVGLGLLYAYLLWLSWTPDTLHLMFASKYWLPELQGIAKMFSSEITLASAWIHLLVVDLYTARQVYHDGLENGIETRHSVSLCLLFCPVGIISHAITKRLLKNPENTKHNDSLI